VGLVVEKGSSPSVYVFVIFCKKKSSPSVSVFPCLPLVDLNYVSIQVEVQETKQQIYFFGKKKVEVKTSVVSSRHGGVSWEL
jgi:hypothetical protein